MPSKKLLTLAHNVFLTKEQIQDVLSGLPAKTVGSIYTTWIESESAKQSRDVVLAEYAITVDPKAVIVAIIVDESVSIALTETLARDLGLPKDGGCENIMATIHGQTTVGSETVPTLHYLSIQPESVLIEST